MAADRLRRDLLDHGHRRGRHADRAVFRRRRRQGQGLGLHAVRSGWATSSNFNLDFKDLDGIDRAFGEYRKLNPETSEAAILIDDQVKIIDRHPPLNAKWMSDSSNIEYRIDLSPPNEPQYTSLMVTVPKSVVFERVARSVKNFAALFIASAFLSGLFLQVAASLQRMSASVRRSQAQGRPTGAGLVIVKPVYFLAVFLDALTYSFLPKFMQEAAAASGVSVAFASIPFTAYYLGFARESHSGRRALRSLWRKAR